MLPCTTAQITDYNSHSSLTIESEISSEIILVQEGPNPEMNYFKTNLSFYPDNAHFQQILSQSYIMLPEDNVNNEGNYYFFNWDNPGLGSLTYGVKTTMKNTNDLVKVRSVVSYPLDPLTEDLLVYTRATENIDITDKIRNQAEELAQGETDLYKLTFNIGEWIKENIEYDLSTLTQEAVQTSSWVLENKVGVCDELTNLYISILRSLGIPARFVAGQAYTNLDESFGNHGWAEVYFPDYGWIPFDVTYSQLGWVDPTHIIYKTSLDSGEPSAEYVWRSEDIGVEIQSLNVHAEVTDYNGDMEHYIEFSVHPLVKEVGAGSYVPVQVTVQNWKNFYVPVAFSFTKAPEIIGSNQQAILLEPNAKKSLYWIVKIPDEIEKEYVYTSILEVKSTTGQVENSSIIYGNNYETYSKELAESTLEQFNLENANSILEGVELNCAFDKKNYFTTDSAKLTCQIESKETKEFDVCFLRNCQQIQGSGIVEWSIQLSDFSTGIQTVYVFDDVDYLYNYLTLNIIQTPIIEIIDYNPKEFIYGENANLTLSLNSENFAQNIVLTIKGQGGATMASLQDTINITLPLKTASVFNGFIPIEISFQDTAGNEYESEQDLPIVVNEIPWILNVYLKIKPFFSP